MTTKLLAILTGMLAWTCAARNPATDVPEYGLKATVPDGLPVCMAETATHVHVVGTVLANSACENRARQPAFNIWADYNVTFEENASKMLAADERCSDSSPAWAQGEWTNAIGGLKTAICRNEQADGTVDLAFAAQAGEWPDESSDVPYINYTVKFKTTRARQDSDVELLKKFLRS